MSTFHGVLIKEDVLILCPPDKGDVPHFMMF